MNAAISFLTGQLECLRKEVSEEREALANKVGRNTRLRYGRDMKEQFILDLVTARPGLTTVQIRELVSEEFGFCGHSTAYETLSHLSKRGLAHSVMLRKREGVRWWPGEKA